MAGYKTPEIILDESIPDLHVYVEPFIESLTEFGESFQTRQKFHILDVVRGKKPSSSRFVMKFSCDGKIYALKYDASDPSKGLGPEYQKLQKVSAIFSKADGLTITKPIYLSRQGHFFVCEWAEGQTATRLIRDQSPEIAPHQVFEQAGRWLGHLHLGQTVENRPFGGEWMVRRMRNEKLVSCMHLPKEIFETALDYFTEFSKRIYDIPTPYVLNHGDFHACNLLLSNRGTTGIDFSELAQKPATMDLMRFMILDLRQQAKCEGLGELGIRQRNVDAFFKGYNVDIPSEVVAFSVQAFLMFRLMRVSQAGYEKSRDVRKNYDKFLERIEFILSNANV